VKVETHCEKGVRFYVPADPKVGEGYFNVWIPAVNDGVKHGPFSYYEWTKWLPMDPGTYEWALAAETKTEDGTVYQCDWHKREFTIPRCKVDPECPRDAFFDINVSPAVPTDNNRVECPDFEAYLYMVSTNLPVVEMILPPGCTADTPTSGKCQFPVEEDTYQVSISGSGKTFGGLLCGSDFETIIIEGCEDCVPCLPRTKVSLENDLVKDAQEDAYRIQTSFTMTPPGKYHLVVSQKTVLRDVTSDIQQAYLTPGNAENPLACGSGPVDVLFEVLDDKCGEDVVCETVTDQVEIPPCECVPCADSSQSLTCRFNETTNKVVCKAKVSHDGRLVMKQSGSPILVEDFTGSRAFFSPVLPCDETPVNVMLINRDSECGEPVRCGVETTTVIPTKECPPGYHLHIDDCTCYCDPVGEPECQEQFWNEETCAWEGECPCEYEITHPLREVFCHENVPGGPDVECAHFAPGTTSIWSGPAFITAQMDADVVIAKTGSGGRCDPVSDKLYKIFEGVQSSDPLPGIGGWSHTTYCNCDEPQ
jgi:hypothetical protein